MRHLPPIALTLTAVAAHADGSCRPEFEAMTRDVDTSSHRIGPSTLGASAAGKGATIDTYAQRCVLVRAPWRVSPMSGHAVLRQPETDIPDSTRKMLCEDAADGEHVIVYPVANQDAGTDGNVSSRHAGLPRKEEFDPGTSAHRLVRPESGTQRPPLAHS